VIVGRLFSPSGISVPSSGAQYAWTMVNQKREEYRAGIDRSLVMVAGFAKRSKALRNVRNWMAQVADPVWAIRGIGGFPRYFADWYRYSRMPKADPIRLVDTYPQVHDRTVTTSIDAHYFYVNGWAMRRIVAARPALHVDVGSQVIFANLLAGVIPVVFVDYRPLEAELPGLMCVGGSLLGLPFADCSLASLSCLHVIEHIGLGRYGEPLDPEGTRKAVGELARVLGPGGNLFLATPVGKPRLCFNAHRIHRAEAIREMVPELELVEFSGVHDDGRYVEQVELSAFQNSEYACGFFWFRRRQTSRSGEIA
jgi:SAM-dependent methyltransferase